MLLVVGGLVVHPGRNELDLLVTVQTTWVGKHGEGGELRIANMTGAPIADLAVEVSCECVKLGEVQRTIDTGEVVAVEYQIINRPSWVRPRVFVRGDRLGRRIAARADLIR